MYLILILMSTPWINKVTLPYLSNLIYVPKSSKKRMSILVRIQDFGIYESAHEHTGFWYIYERAYEHPLF
jgi:hypothetical protein